MSIFQIIDRYYTLALRIMMGAAAAYIGLMMATIVYFTVFRAVGLPYSDYSHTVIEYGFIYVLMLGTPWLVRTRGHVYIELVTGALSPRGRNIWSRVVAGLSAVVCLVLGWYTGVLTVHDFINSEYDQLRGQLDIQRWIVIGAMPIGFGLMGIEFLRYVFGPRPMHTGEVQLSEA